MRILQVIDQYPPAIGGAEIQTQRLSRQLVQRGHQVAVITCWQRNLPYFRDEDGVQVYRIRGWISRLEWLYADPTHLDSPPYPDPGLILATRRVLNEFKPDVIMVYGWIVYSIAAALIGKNIPMVVMSRDYQYACATRLLMHRRETLCSGPGLSKCMACASIFYGRAKGPILVGGIFGGRWLLKRKARAFVSVSRFVREMVGRDLLGRSRENAEFGTDGIPNVVIYNAPADTNSTNVDQSILDQLPKEPFILFVGRFVREKGLHILVDAYKKLKNPPPLVLIGSPSTEDMIPIPEGTTVIHKVPHATVMAAWERCSFAVVPSTVPDSLPGVVLEAMSKGKAVVGSAVGGLLDMVVNEQTGLLFPLGDVQAMADAMQKLIDNPELNRAYGAASKQRIDEFFTAENASTQFESLFMSLVGTNAKQNHIAHS